MAWLHLGSVTLATFLASLVEFIEALTIVLAVGTTRGWRSAMFGTMAAIFALALVTAIAGPAIQLVPIHWMQLVIGTIVTVFGLRWLKKATLRSAGRIPFHDEDLEYAKEVAALAKETKQKRAIDKIAFVTAFKAVFLEGFEVAFIVITAGNAVGHLDSAAIGAGIALVTVIALGFLIHRPLARVPENSLKKTVGIMLSALGIFWLGEGLGFKWPMNDAFVLVLAGVFTAASFTTTAWLKRSRASSQR